ncbi:hypothetical protein E4T66_01625 [Sinimarinibacterium sp. CAU 1509]|uniref:hypothetical protein n=1 Tax=Sinimarinibacterium sp. CAU 1509 TaxID=2562283 RepID=UPI0010AB7E0A|nr:hypothetical protein [Sinimarinibacterium sp. CAU 1509]TJY64952.1 hypothetical protein E4T66_01625 [Sinimarinibacterium sp. CAU 1509]
MNAADFCLLGAGVFFLSGLLSGVWKYRAIMTSEQAQAPVYIDITHRASLMYAFSALLLREFVPYSPLSASVTLWVVAVPLLFFASAIVTYIVHGVLRDTDNQLRRPHVLGRGQVSGVLIGGYMAALIAGEIGGFAILFYGFLRGL